MIGLAGLHSLVTQPLPNSGCCKNSFPHMCRTEDSRCILSVGWRDCFQVSVMGPLQDCMLFVQG